MCKFTGSERANLYFFLFCYVKKFLSVYLIDVNVIFTETLDYIL